MNFYDELKRLVKLRGITIDILMEKSIGKNLHTFQGWKQRNTLPRADELYAICKVLSVPMEHFFDEEKANEVLPERFKSLFSAFDQLSDSELDVFRSMSADQLRAVVQMYSSLLDAKK